MHARIAARTAVIPALVTIFLPVQSIANAKDRQSFGNSGSLSAVNLRGEPVTECPLKHTDVHASVSGPVARVKVTQEFTNAESQRIEAVYKFPLPPDAAVDQMTICVGRRTIKAVIKDRAEARKIYESARERGSLASLLDQERPNIFTQSVANIQPGETIKVEISYVELVPFEDGRYCFRFPMVVGPRYIPGHETGRQGGGWSPDTDQVPDASKITPPVTPKGTRSGHDISLTADLDPGVPIEDIRSTTHEVLIERSTPHTATVKLADQKSIPNKDFVLTYDVLGKTIGDAVLTHTDKTGGYFTLLITPPDRPAPSEITPKELVFVLDTSGSMSGFPIQKAKETMAKALGGLHPKDTFNLITFSGSTEILFPAPVPATPENLRKAQRFLDERQGMGGTEMMAAIRAALAPSDAQDHVRVVCFMTDGYVGNDMEILSEIRKHPKARVFAFGVGNAVNHYLLDGMARYGRGEVEYVGLNDDGATAVKRFSDRVRSPILTDIHVDWGGLDVHDVFPQGGADLFSAKPLTICGRYGKPGRGLIRLSGKQAGKPYAREIQVEFPSTTASHDEIASMWARRKVEALMASDLAGIQAGNPNQQVKSGITQLGLQYRLVTQFTSLVAVEERTVTDKGKPKRVQVPVEMPDGTSYDGVFGAERQLALTRGLVGGVPSGVNMEVVAAPILSMVFRAPEQELQQHTVPMRAQAVAVDPVAHAITTKLHQDLASIAMKLKKRQPLSQGELALIHNGLIAVTVQIADRGTLAKLTAAGFQSDGHSSSGTNVRGRIKPERLGDLAQIPGVIFIAPDRA
jgi:Ca-activated chloride channel homolog